MNHSGGGILPPTQKGVMDYEDYQTDTKHNNILLHNQAGLYDINRQGWAYHPPHHITTNKTIKL